MRNKALGKDAQGVPVSDAQPTLRIPEIVVGGGVGYVMPLFLKRAGGDNAGPQRGLLAGAARFFRGARYIRDLTY